MSIDTSNDVYAVAEGLQRKGFYAEGLFWAFYRNIAGAPGWEFSADGTTWAGAFTSIGACVSGRDFSVWFDGTYIHYVRYANYDLFYRRGTPVNDGSINWSAAEQTVYDGAAGNIHYNPCIAVDTGGYAWIGVDYFNGSNHTVYVFKNAANDGTWSEDFRYQLTATTSATLKWRAIPVPLTDGKVYVIYCVNSQLPLGKLYDAGWGAQENDLADNAIEDSYGCSAVALGDNVHFVYNRDVTYQIRHNERVYGGGWDAADVLVQDTVTSSTGPALSADPSTSDSTASGHYQPLTTFTIRNTAVAHGVTWWTG